MAGRKASGPQNGGPINPPDYERAQKIFDNDIKPANKAQKQAMGEASAGWKAIKGERVHVAGFRQAQKIADMEESDQQAFLRALHAGFKARGVVMHPDAVDRMQGNQNNEIPIIPTGEAPKIDMPVVN